MAGSRLTGDDRFGHLARQHLVPLLTQFGFADAQGTTTELLFCGPPELGAKFPDIVASYGPQIPPCLDLHVHGTGSGGVVRADFEGRPLDLLLEQQGRGAEAVELRRRLGHDVEDALSAIAAAVTALFG